MNIRKNSFEIKCKSNQTFEALAAFFHPIIYLRTFGKVVYHPDGTCYSLGSLHYDEILCDFINVSYVRCTSPTLLRAINEQLLDFTRKLNENQSHCGIIELEFYSQKSRRIWPFNDQTVWEIWSVKVSNDDINSSDEKLQQEMLRSIQRLSDDRSFTPTMPSRQNLDSVFDTKHTDVQPFLHRMRMRIGPSFEVCVSQDDPSLGKLLAGVLAV